MKRLTAYVIDIIIVSIFLFFINSLVNTINESNLVTLNDNFINNKITVNEYYDNYVVINHNIAKENILTNILSLILTIIYFVILPLKNDGKTLGKQIFKLEIQKQDEKELKFFDLIKRSILIHGIFYLFVMIILVYILPSKTYFWIENILGIMQISIVIISGFMVLYRKDKLGLHDIWAKTVVKEREK